MTTERRPRGRMEPPEGAPGNTLKRIPLPPLPHFRTRAAGPSLSPEAPAQSGAGGGEAAVASSGLRLPETAASASQATVSHDEMSGLLERGSPEQEGSTAQGVEPAVPQRTGATGAAIMNDLVDEIEKGLEKDLARATFEVVTQSYRRVLACAAGPLAGRAAEPAPPSGPLPQSGCPERRTGE